jgi:hypothetical protein
MSDMRRIISLLEHATVEGLPDGIRLSVPELQKIIDSGFYRAIARHDGKTYHGDDAYEIELHPADPGNAKTYPDRKIHAYYDPNLAKLEVTDYGDGYIRTHAILKTEHDGMTIEPLGGDIIYRGISSNEWDSILETGKVQSRGDHNIGDEQVGLTYWSTDIDSAISYANGFAPAAYKPTFGRSSYVIAAHRPKETRHVEGVASHEVGVARPISMKELVAVWQSHTWAYQPRTYSIRPEPDWKAGGYHYTMSSAGGGSAQVIWERIK